MPHPNAFSPSWFEGPEFFAKIIGVFNNFLPKKYEGFRSSVVEQWSSNARVVSSNPGLAKTFFFFIYCNFNFSILFLPKRQKLRNPMYF